MKKFGTILIFCLAASCSIKERPISYGTDDCDYCKMTIMDHRYGSELVTQKGKVYTFDAAECLIDYLYYHEELNKPASLFFVTPYTHADTLIDARKAFYLVSREMPSPMGAYLTAFLSLETADGYRAQKGGELYSWEELFTNFRTIKSGVIQQQ